MNTKLIGIVCVYYFLVTTIYCISFQEQRQGQKIKQKKRFDRQIQARVQQIRNVTFPSITEKYLYVYYPFIQNCYQYVGDDYQSFYQSAKYAGISSASLATIAGTKLAISVGVAKAGILGILKTAGAAVISTTGLPIALGVGAVSYFFIAHSQDQIKLKCKRIIQFMQNHITQQQLFNLKAIKQKYYHNFIDQSSQLNKAIKSQKNINLSLYNYEIKVGSLNPIYFSLRNYFKVYHRLISKR